MEGKGESGGDMRKDLKEARKRAGMTQKEVAEYLGMTERAYQNIEYGKALGKITHWDMLEDLFGIPQRQLRVQDASDKRPVQQDNQVKHQGHQQI